MVRSPESGVYMPERFLDIAEEIYNFEVRPTDIWVVTFPKCGTTVVQVLLLLQHLSAYSDNDFTDTGTQLNYSDTRFRIILFG